MMNNPSTEMALTELLDAWADAVGRHEPERVAELFTADALFQGFDPAPGHGPGFVASYYQKQPLGLRAEHDILDVSPAGRGHLIGFARVRFDRPDGVVPVYLTIAARKTASGWRISHYHVSKIPTG